MAFVVVAVLVVTLVAGWLVLGDRASSGPPEPTYRELRIADLFEDLENSGYDTKGPLEWKYVFMHREYAPLASLAKLLRDRGYTIVEAEEMTEPENEFVEHRIVFSKRETHTPDSLAARNLEMTDFAERCGVDLYDGSWVIDPNAEEPYADEPDA